MPKRIAQRLGRVALLGETAELCFEPALQGLGQGPGMCLSARAAFFRRGDVTAHRSGRTERFEAGADGW